MSASPRLSPTTKTTTITSGRGTRLRLAAAGFAVAGVSLLGACSAESLIESGIEKGIEAGTGAEDVNIGEDGGSFSFESEGETVELDFGNDGGSLKVTDAEGNESGLDLDITEDGGSLTVTENGESETFNGTVDDNGLVVTDESGEKIIEVDTATNGAGDVPQPDWFPADFPVPTGLRIDSAHKFGPNGIIVAAAPGSPEAIALSFLGDAQAAGWTHTEVRFGDTAQYVLESSEGMGATASFTTDDSNPGLTTVGFSFDGI